MAAGSRFPDLIRLVPAGGGAVAGLAVAAVVMALPVASLDRAVWDSGLAALAAAAQPPLGATARLLLAIGGGVGTAAVSWAALFLLVGPGGLFARRLDRVGGATFRRADLHPDAPLRCPMTAADLGTPLMEVAVPVSPPAPPVAAASPSLAPGERLDTFTLTPPPPTRPATSGAAPSIDALLRRLEAGAARLPARL